MYLDSKKITINWRLNFSPFAKANKDNLQELPRNIGSSNSAVSKMVSNGDELKAIMPEIISLSPNSPDWDAQIKNYWDSLSYPIMEGGKELEIGFKYDSTDSRNKDYINQLKKEDEKAAKLSREDLDKYLADYHNKQLGEIEAEYAKELEEASVLQSKERERAERDAYNKKFTSVINLESEKYKLGKPINASEYMIYRYCLVYKDVANDPKYMDKSKDIRFYLYSREQIEKDKRTQYNIEKQALQVYLEMLSSKSKVENMLFVLGRGSEAINAEDDTDLHIMLKSELNTNSQLFLSTAKDPNLKERGQIEKLIFANILKRLPNTTIIVDANNPSNVIGNNIEEAISYFGNDKNKVQVSEYLTKYKSRKK